VVHSGCYCLFREIIKSNQQQHHQLNCDYIYNTQMDSALPLPPAAMPESLLSLYQSSFCDPNKADSGLTYNLPLQRKRSRDFTTELTSLPPHQKNKISPQPSFLSQEILYQFQHQQSEIDRVLAHHVINSPPLIVFSVFFFFNSNGNHSSMNPDFLQQLFHTFTQIGNLMTSVLQLVNQI